MFERDIASPKLDLNRRPDQLPLLVDLQGYFEFSFWMAEELLDLEAQYGSWGPRAQKPLPWEIANLDLTKPTSLPYPPA